MDIYELELHRRTKVKNGVYVTRVPGGWIYEIGNDVPNPNPNFKDWYVQYSLVFIPFNNEFMHKINK